MLRKQFRPAIVMTVLLCLLTGAVYPGIVTGLSQLMFPRQANGSLVSVNGKVVGSALIGQAFSQPYYFHPRPSAAGSGYDPIASSGTNKGPTDLKLADTLVTLAIDSVMKNDHVAKGSIPGDMVTSSASGLDPDISPANAQLQVARVAAARGATPASIRALVDAHTAGRQFGFFGEPHVNVLLLNIALDSVSPRRPAPQP
jgi:potassium-transporting ATPase KdpC subunit